MVKIGPLPNRIYWKYKLCLQDPGKPVGSQSPVKQHMKLPRILLTSTLIGCSLANLHCSTTHTNNKLGVSRNNLIVEIPTNIKWMSQELDSLEKENINSEDFIYSTTFQEEKRKIFVPSRAMDMTTSRAKCLEEGLDCASIEDILQANLHQMYRTLRSTSYMTNTKGKLKCHIRSTGQGEECWDQIKNLQRNFSLTSNTNKLKSKMENTTLGILAINSNSLDIVSSKAELQLPCVGSNSDQQPPTHWNILKKNFIKPKLSHLRQLFQTLGLEGTKARKKRSLMGSIFGLASEGEVETLRSALKIELSSQRETNSAMEKMLRTQIIQAQEINKENKELYKLKAEEEGIKDNVIELTKYLETAITNSTENSHQLEQRLMTLLHYITLMQKIENLETKIETLLDLVNCPYGTCTRIISELANKHLIGEIKTYPLMGELLNVEVNNEKISIQIQNITVEEGLIIKVKCIPFSYQDETVITDITGTYLANKGKGFYKIADECDRSHGLIYCDEQPVYRHNRCLEDTISLNKNSSVNCEDYIRKAPEGTKQDMYIKDGLLEIWSSIDDSITLQYEKNLYKSSLKKGTNHFRIEKSNMVNIETRYLSHTRTLAPVKIYQEQTQTDITDEEGEMELLSTQIEAIETRELTRIEKQLAKPPPMNGEFNTLEVPEFTTRHPVLDFLFLKTESSWWIWPLMLLMLLMCVGIFISWKCTLWPFNKCRKRRSSNDDIEMQEKKKRKIKSKEEEKEMVEEPLMPTKQKTTQEEVKYQDMRMENLGFTVQIRSIFMSETIGWTGTTWRTLNNNTLLPMIKEPPLYMIQALKAYEGGVDLVEGKYPYICLKGYPNTYWDRCRHCWFLLEANKKVFLPEYTHPPPDAAIINLLSLSKAERDRANK